MKREKVAAFQMMVAAAYCKIMDSKCMRDYSVYTDRVVTFSEVFKTIVELVAQEDVVVSNGNRKSYLDRRANGLRLKVFLKEGYRFKGSDLYQIRTLANAAFDRKVKVKTRYRDNVLITLNGFAKLLQREFDIQNSYISVFIPYTK